MQARLLETTFDRKFAVVLGSLMVVLIAVTAMVILGALWPLLWIAAELTLLPIRLLLMQRCEQARDRDATGPLGALMASGGIWSVITGLSLYGCLASGNMVLAVLGALSLAGVAGVASTRNAATPRYAICVMIAITLPYTVGALLSPVPGMFVIGIQIPVYFFGLVRVLLQNHAINARMITAELDNRTLAVTDALTSLPNRMLLQEALREMCDKLVAAAANDGKPIAVLSMDLDGFKHVNDNYGHAVGDTLLRHVGDRLRHSIRQSDSVFRIGGDEFVIVLAGVTQFEAAHVAKRAIETVSAPYDLGTGLLPVRIGLSVGGAFAPLDGITPEQLLARSDQALYEAKRAGKGRFRAHMRSVS